MDDRVPDFYLEAAERRRAGGHSHAMPTLEFKGKQHIYAHHLTVPHRPLIVNLEPFYLRHLNREHDIFYS